MDEEKRETKTITLSTGIEIVLYSYMITKEMFEIQKAPRDDTPEYSIKQFIIKFGDETDKQKIYDKVMNLKIVDYKLIDTELSLLLDPFFAKKK